MRILACLVLSAICLTACNNLNDLDRKVAEAVKGVLTQKTDVQPPASPEVATRPEAPAVPPAKEVREDSDTALLQKLNGYIECLNRAVPRAEDSYKRYLSWVSKPQGPTCKEPYITYGLYSLYDDSIKRCQDAADKGKASGPSLPGLEAAANDMAACNATLVPLVKKAADYYEQQDYKDDACSKGREMHPQLVATFEKCLDTAKKLSDGVDKLKDDLDRRRLGRFDEAGPSFQAEVLRMMIAAKDVLKTIDTGEKGAPLSKEASVAKCLELEKAYQRLEDYASAHKPEVDKTFWGSPFLSSAKECYSSVKFLRRDLEGGQDPREKVNEFIERYNRLVNDSNNLRF